MEFELSLNYVLWVLLLALCAIVWYFVQKFATSILERLDTMVKQNAITGEELVRVKTEQSAIIKTIDSHENRINNHADRLRSIELGCAKHNSK